LPGRDRPICLELGDIDQELHGGTPETVKAVKATRDLGLQRGAQRPCWERIGKTALTSS
jgi:hypothetical protein